MAFKGKDGSGWKEANAIYGKDADGWKYAKVVYAKDGTGWKRAWTDCRKHDEGGRDWTASSPVTEYQGSCGTRESRTKTDYTKEGCESYTRYSAWVSSPNCGSVGSSPCWTDVTCNYVGQTNVTWGGVVYAEVVDLGGLCAAYQNNCYYTFYLCGSIQDVIASCS